MKRAAQAAAILLLAASVHAGGSVTAKKAALSTDHPLATKVGLAVLQRGGNAADAAVAVALALAVVRPQSGGIGGGGFATYYDAETHGVWTLDFRETAPRLITKDAKVVKAMLEVFEADWVKTDLGKKELKVHEKELALAEVAS